MFNWEYPEVTNTEERSPCSSISISEGWARCVGEGQQRQIQVQSCWNACVGAHMVFCSLSPLFKTLCWQVRRWLERLWDAWCLWAESRERSPSPGSLSSSQDRSSELTSARLGVRLESSESEAASFTLTSPPWHWGSRDAPKSKVQVWLRCSAMPWKLEVVCLDTGPRSLAEHLTSSFNSETMALLKQISNIRKQAGSSQTHTHAHTTWSDGLLLLSVNTVRRSSPDRCSEFCSCLSVRLMSGKTKTDQDQPTLL